MPFPLLALVPPLIAWGTRSVAVYGLARLFSEEPVQELKNMLFGYIVKYALRYAGLQLDPNDPISDASLSNAVSERLGFNIRTLKDKQVIKEDLENYAALMISQKAGFTIHSVTDINILRADLQRVACAVLSEKLNLPVGIIPGDGEELNVALVRERLLAWAKAELTANLSETVGLSLDEIGAMGDVEGLAEELNGRLADLGSDKLITARRIAVQVASKLATGAISDYQRVAVGMTKRQRRQEQVRQAQAKFRRAHGNRVQYIPLGMTAVIS